MLEWCCKLAPHHPYAINNLAYVYILLKKYKEAGDACSEAYNKNRVARNYFRNWAIALMNQKQYSTAVEIVKEAIELNPTSYSISSLNYRELDSMGRDNEG
jgi:Flp pilus assembly protein TadD